MKGEFLSSLIDVLQMLIDYPDLTGYALSSLVDHTSNAKQFPLI